MIKKIKAIDFIEAWDFSYHLGQAIKQTICYIYSDSSIKNLQKAHWHLSREFSLLYFRDNPCYYRPEISLTDLIRDQAISPELKPVLYHMKASTHDAGRREHLEQALHYLEKEIVLHKDKNL